MPPARSRVVQDDARSDISMTNPKDRVVSSSGNTKGRKSTNNTANGPSSLNKVSGSAAATSVLPAVASSQAVDSEQDHPHIDWSTLPIQCLQSYRSTYRLQIPSAYTRPHAELLYNSCDLALRAPSKVLARRKTQDLRSYRRHLAIPTSDARMNANGVSKPTKASRSKDKDKKPTRARDKANASNEIDAAQDSIEAPLSPNSHPSQVESISASVDDSSRPSRTASIDRQTDLVNNIPATLNQSNPDSTVISSTSASVLSTSIRKHFNAQQLNEADTIARFSYVVRQLGSNTSSRVQPLAQRSGPLPPTTAELIAATAAQAAQAATSAVRGGLPITVNAASGANTMAPASSAPAKSAAHPAHSLSAPRTLAGNHVQVEGSYGDGHGWIIGTTSCGRQVRTSDSVGGGGTFRLRFRPAPWGQEVVGSRMNG